jgi:hypothetical protein
VDRVIAVLLVSPGNRNVESLPAWDESFEGADGSRPDSTRYESLVAGPLPRSCPHMMPPRVARMSITAVTDFDILRRRGSCDGSTMLVIFETLHYNEQLWYIHVRRLCRLFLTTSGIESHDTMFNAQHTISYMESPQILQNAGKLPNGCEET